MQEIKVKNN